METIFTQSNVTFILGMLAILFSVYNYFKNPQISLDKKQAIDKTEEEGKAKVLEQRVQWAKEDSEKRFAEFNTRLDSTFTMAKNDISHVDAKLTMKISNDAAWQLEMSKHLTRLETIIDERMPRIK